MDFLDDDETPLENSPPQQFHNDAVAAFLQEEDEQLRELGITDIDEMSRDLTDQAPLDGFTTSDVQVDPEVVEAQSLINDISLDDEPVMIMGSAPAASSSIFQHAGEEPEFVRKWREEKEVELEQKAEDERVEEEAWVEQSKKELEDWYERYNTQLEKTHNENRVAEKEFVDEMTGTRPGNEWEKVSAFCDFNPKSSKCTKDVSRMRSLLLQMKQTPLVR